MGCTLYNDIVIIPIRRLFHENQTPRSGSANLVPSNSGAQVSSVTWLEQGSGSLLVDGMHMGGTGRTSETGAGTKSAAGSGHSDPQQSQFMFLGSYRNMGFNTVPLKSMQEGFAFTAEGAALTSDADNWLYPGNRSGSAWEGLVLGSQLSGTGPSGGAAACKAAPNVSLLPPGLSGEQRKVEMTKWRNAWAFYNATKTLDIAYPAGPRNIVVLFLF